MIQVTIMSRILCPFIISSDRPNRKSYLGPFSYSCRGPIVTPSPRRVKTTSVHFQVNLGALALKQLSPLVPPEFAYIGTKSDTKVSFNRLSHPKGRPSFVCVNLRSPNLKPCRHLPTSPPMQCLSVQVVDSGGASSTHPRGLCFALRGGDPSYSEETAGGRVAGQAPRARGT